MPIKNKLKKKTLRQKQNKINKKKSNLPKNKIKKKISRISKVFTIPENVKFIGNLDYPHDVILEGIFDGNINAKNITISKKCRTKGEIHCDTITVYGTCHADIYVKNKCILESSSILNCEIYYESDISIKSGAKILGRLIPKKHPLALPNYSNANKSDESLISNAISNTNQVNLTKPSTSKITKERGLNSIDKIISKIFK